MFSYDPLHKSRRLWNDAENIISDSIGGVMLMHQNLVYIDSCKAVVRQDLDKLNKKVRIIGGGAVIDGLMYAGFVGPGMLTAAVLGLQKSPPHIPTSDTILEVINHVVKNDEHKAIGVLLLVHDCPEYYLSFLEAKNKAESQGIATEVIYVRDEVTEKLSQKPASSPRSPSGLLLLYKIAGAMSEEENSLYQIYITCNDIIEKKAIFSTGVYLAETSDKTAEIQISRGDVLSDRDKACFPMEKSSTSKIIEHVINDMMNVDNCKTFFQGSKLAILFDHFNGFSELEANIVMKELVQQLNRLKFKVRIFYTGAFHVSLDLKGFHLSLLNMSNNLKYLYYLNVPTGAYAWPKTNSRQILLKLPSESNGTEEKKKTDNCKTENNDEPKVVRKILTVPKTRETDLLITAIDYACEALIACFMKIDLLDNPKIPPAMERCGTRLAFIADLIRTEIQKKEFDRLGPPEIMYAVARIFDYNKKDLQGLLYTSLLKTIGRELLSKRNFSVKSWLEAFTKATEWFDLLVQGSKFAEALNVARISFCNAYTDDGDVDVIHALGQAVNAVQKLTAHVTLKSGKIPDNLISGKDYGLTELAGAHAIGVWMRGAYEGLKLKYYSSSQAVKRKASDDCESKEVVSKTVKYSLN